MTAKKKPAKPTTEYKPVLIRLTAEQHERFRLAAVADQRPLTIFITRAVEKFLEKENQK